MSPTETATFDPSVPSVGGLTEARKREIPFPDGGRGRSRTGPGEFRMAPSADRTSTILAE